MDNCVVTICRLSTDEEPRSEALCLRNKSDKVAWFAGFLLVGGMRWLYKVIIIDRVMQISLFRGSVFFGSEKEHGYLPASIQKDTRGGWKLVISNACNRVW